MGDMTDEQKRLEAESWKKWQTAWGNTESGAHAFGWLNGYNAAVNRAAGDAEREAGLQEIAAGMAACVEALDKNQLWFSRSHVSLTLRDSLRTWAEEYAALSASTAPRADAEGQGES